MADPYHNQQDRTRAYPGAYSHGPHPQHLHARRSSFDNGDDLDYFDGGTGVARRPSVTQQTDEQYYDQHRTLSTDRRGSLSMADNRPQQSPGFFAVTPGVNSGNPAYRQPYSPGFPPSYETDPPAPYPPTPGYNGNHSPPAPAPYNPAAYQPQRHNTTATMYTPPDLRPQRHASTAAAFSPTSAQPPYSPGFNNAPYPYPSGSRQPLPMPGSTGPRPHPAQAPFVGHNSQQYATRTQYVNSYGVSHNQPYSPGLPPLPQSAPPQNNYQPPPPPPPPHPPNSPGYFSPSHGGYGQAPQPNHLSNSHMGYLTRPETHYQSGSESDISADPDYGTPHHPLPSPPKERSHSHDARYGGYSNSQPLPSPPPPAPPSHSLGRSDSRPLPPTPHNRPEDLYADVEASLMDMGSGTGSTAHRTHGRSPQIHVDAAQDIYSGAGYDDHRMSMENGTNGHLDTALGSVYDYYSGESDMEAVAGLEAMRQDEEREVEQRRRESQNSVQAPAVPAEVDPDDSELDYAMAGMDLGNFGGDFGGAPGYYGSTDFGQTYSAHSESSRGNGLPSPPPPPPPIQTQVSTYPQRESSGRSAASGPGMIVDPVAYGIPDETNLHPFPDFHSTARVDNSGTGGLSKPSQIRRLSFDEGDEELAWPEEPLRNLDSDDDDFPELFYHPPPSASSANRPLPSPPYTDYIPELRPAGSAPYQNSEHQRSGSISERMASYSGVTSPTSPLAYNQMNLSSPQQPYIPRAISMNNHSNTPPSLAPVRSKTDSRTHTKRTSMLETEPAAGLAPSDLPAIPLTRKFDPKKLGGRDFRKCSEPWALSSISAWLKEVTEGELDLKEAAVADAISALFTHFVPTMNIADAETLAAKVVGGMMKEKNLVKEEEWVRFGEGTVGGVVYQITGNGCYSPKLHEIDVPGRCYAHHCARTLKKIQLTPYGTEQKEKMQDWASFWKIKMEDIEGISKKEVERQNNLHEIVQTEEEYLEQMNVLKTVYRDHIANANPPLIKPTRVESFVRDVFGKAEAVRKVTEEHLLPQLKFRQREQGPWIIGFSDIFREWIRKAKTAYLDYAAGFPRADMLVRREASRNMLFSTFLVQCRQDPRTKRLDWVTFLKGPITRLQRYSLLLSTVLKHTTTETEEKHNLARAIEEIKAVTLECDARVDEMSKRVSMLELQSKLIMRQQWDVELRLEEKGRELIFQGDLQRTGNNRFTWLETHCILFDHYLVLAKTTMQKEAAGGVKHERYDVSRMPIPMDLLVLESTNDDPVVRGTASKFGISGPATVATPSSRADARGRHNTLNTVPTLPHTNSAMSVASAPGKMVTNLDQNNTRDDKILYPFRVKHLGNPARYGKAEDNTYILYAPTAQNRQDWCEKIILAKEKHATALHAQNAEPFRLKVMADSAFGYDSASAAANAPKPIKIRGTPLHRAVEEVEKQFEHEGPGRPNVICRASVNCATAFTAQFGREMVAIGTDYGVFTSDANNPRGWTRAIPALKVTQLAVLEEFSLFLVLADKALIAYHLDIIAPPPTASAVSAAAKQKAPQKLSGAKDVGFFATGRMKERTLVFYKKREGISSTFKVLEPVFQKATEKKSRFGRKGTTEFFREFDEFYIPTECFGINLFHSSLAIQTAKGFEVMALDKKRPWSVPELDASHVADIASRVSSQKPLGMFRLSDIEFLLCYEECAVYVNKHGDVSRSVIMEFVGKAKHVALYGLYVLVFDADFVEIRNAQNGRLRQVIAGRDVRCIDDAMNTAGRKGSTVKVAMAHPEIEGRQLVLELAVNEGQRD